MNRPTLFILTLIIAGTLAQAQPEFYSEAYLGLPEFRALALHLPSHHPDSVKVEIHIRIVYDDLQFVKTGEIYKAGYGLDVILRDMNDHLASYNHVDRELKVTQYAQTNSRQIGDQTKTVFSVAPDRYDMKIVLIDRESRKSRILEHEIYFSDKEWQQPCRLGDLALVDSNGVAHLSSGITPGEPIRIAHRLYCEEKTSLSLLYQLLDAYDRVVLGGKIDLQGEGPYFAETLVLPTDSLTNQSYTFALNAKLGKTSLTRTYPIQLLGRDMPDFIRDLDLAIEQLKYIATDSEYDRIREAPPHKREELFQTFWKSKDPSPSSPENEKMEEYYRRIDYANRQFSGYGGGWKTDMGKVYIIFGPPSDVKRQPFSHHSKPYEIWYYYDIRREFVFVDEEGFGQYRLTTPMWTDY
jgi:GWxTD domain-containing protein